MFATVPGPVGAVRRLVGALAARPFALLVGLLIGLAFAGAQVVSAHTDIEFTLPTDGAVVGEPVREITIGFDDPVTLIGPGFELLDPQGNILTPFVATDDDRVFRLQIDPPIGGGEAAVRYEVRAEDGHTISGGFSFTILADAPTTTAAVTTTTAAAVTTTAAATSSTASTGTSTSSTAAADLTTPVVTSLAQEESSPSATEPATIVPEATTTAAPTVTDDEDSPTGTYVAVAAVLVVAIAGAFLAFRSRAVAT